MFKACQRFAYLGLVLPISLFAAGSAWASSFDIPVDDFYWGGLNNYSGDPGSALPPNKDVIESSTDHSFDIYGIRATKAENSSDLTVTIYTNYANTVSSGISGADNTKIGDLFIANGPVVYNNGGLGSNYQVVPGVPSTNNQNDYHEDSAAAAFAAPASAGGPVARFQYAADASGVGLYALNQTNPGADIQLSYWGYTPGTNFRGGQAVNVDANSGDPTVGGVGVSVQVVHGPNGSSDGTNNNYGGGEIIFTLSNLFDNISLGNSNGTFTLAWAMTCANDTIYATFTPFTSNVNPAPLPSGLPLFISGGFLFVGFLTWRRNQKKGTHALSAA